MNYRVGCTIRSGDALQGEQVSGNKKRGDSALSWSDFSPSHFASLEIPLVVVPTVVASLAIWWKGRSPDFEVSERAAGSVSRDFWPRWSRPGKLSRFPIGVVAFLLGLVACVGWLSWTTGDKFDAQGPSYPPPSDFPPWQIAALGLTLTVVALLTSMYATRVKSGALISPLFSAAGFSTAMAIGSAHGVTSQEGVGVGLSMVGLTVSLGIITMLCAFLRSERLKMLAK